MRPNDVEARLEDMTALGTAASPDELHTALVLRPPAAFEREHSVPLNYFVRAHERGPAAAVTTAMLLVTDPRWVPVAQRLMRAIAATGIVSDDDLDLLAEVFVVAGPQVYWACPDGWLDGPGVVIDFDDGPTPISVDGTSTEDDHPPTVAARAVAGRCSPLGRRVHDSSNARAMGPAAQPGARTSRAKRWLRAPRPPRRGRRPAEGHGTRCERRRFGPAEPRFGSLPCNFSPRRTSRLLAFEPAGTRARMSADGVDGLHVFIDRSDPLSVLVLGAGYRWPPLRRWLVRSGTRSQSSAEVLLHCYLSST